MTGAGIDDGDILVIDRSIEPINNKIAVCLIDGEFTVKRIKIEGEQVFLMPENSNYKPIKIELHNEFVVWGIVTYVIKKDAMIQSKFSENKLQILGKIALQIPFETGH